MIDFFKSEPVDQSTEDGYWCYELSLPNNTKIRFSVNLYERSVQTELYIGNTSMVTVSHESAAEMTIKKNQLMCEFYENNLRTVLVIDSMKNYGITWSTIQIRETT